MQGFERMTGTIDNKGGIDTGMKSEEYFDQ